MPNLSSLLNRCFPIALAFMACALVSASPALADPPGRIGRIAWLSGAVSLQNPGSGESFSAPINQPLTSGDVLTTDPDSRTEIQIGSMTVRLDAGSTIELARINDEEVRLYLRDGRTIVKLSTPDAVHDFELATRNGRFSARDTGIYRFDAEANSSSATTFYGTLHFAANDSTLDIPAGQRAQFWYSGQTRYRLSAATGDDFNLWSASRDQRPAANSYSRYVSPEMTGAEDLDAYGNWSESPEYGVIWYPRGVAADWAPYRTGHWAWVEPWGWSWVGHEPWGFAPFHYGRWVHQHGAWGWVPGTRIARPVYAPAMVAWVGTSGAGVSMSIGRPPTMGWFPLAPHEVYVPVYRGSPNYVRNINITHVPHIANVDDIVRNPQGVIQHSHYIHREMPQAVTVVPSDSVTHRRPATPQSPPPGDRHDQRERPVHAAPLVETRIDPRGPQQDHRERQAAPQPAPDSHNVSRPTAAPRRQAPATPTFAPQRYERPDFETTRPAPQPRPEAQEPRAQDRPIRRVEPVMHLPQREARAEPPQQPARQAPPPSVRTDTAQSMVLEPRHGAAPRETGRPAGEHKEQSQQPHRRIEAERR
jgi:hypothetical protein